MTTGATILMICSIIFYFGGFGLLFSIMLKHK